MNPLWPAALAAVGAAVAVGLPPPARSVLARPVSLRKAPHWLLPVVVLAAALVLSGVVAAVLATVLVVVARRALQHRRHRAERRRERAAAAEGLAALAAELRAGRVPADAFEGAAELSVGPTATALLSAAAALRWGGGPEDALARHAEASAAPEMLLALAACWQVCSGTGSSLATAVDRLVEGLRQAARQRDLVETEAAEAQASALVVACLPAAGVLLGYMIGGNPLHVLLHTSVGIVCLVLGIGLDLLGLWWTRRMVAAAIGGAA